MSDLHQAVQEKIAEHTPALLPPFEALKERRARRARMQRAAAVAVAAVAVTGVVAVPVLISDADRLPAGPATDATKDGTADGPNPQTIIVDGVEFVRTGPAAVSGAYTDPNDPSALFVYAGRADKPGYCANYAAVRVAAQDAQTVTLDAAHYEPAAPPPADSGCSLLLPPPQQHRLDLGIPLAGRRVVTTQGEELKVLDTGTLLVPTALPEGYRLPGTLTVGYSGTDDAGNDVTVYTYPGPDSQTQIEVYQGLASKVPGRDEPVHPSVVIDRPTVRGHSAVVTETAGLMDLTCLRWKETQNYTVMVCSRGNPAPLRSAELQAVAASMRPASAAGPDGDAGDPDGDEPAAARCGPGVSEEPCGAGLPEGKPYSYLLRTHCGVKGLYADGRQWVPEAGQDVGENGAPAGFDDPEDLGSVTLISDALLSYRSASGVRLRFIPGEIPQDDCN